MQNTLKNELRTIISGKGQVRHGGVIQAIARYLEDGTKASALFADSKYIKDQEATHLRSFITGHSLWLKDIDFSCYVSEGAEQKVYLKDELSVFKLNDAIYYSSWLDYFRNLLLHNYFFPDTAYELTGFAEKKGVLYAVVKQPFVVITERTDLAAVKQFLAANGFQNVRNNDYINTEIGVILEDLHDENVLTRNGILYFIDTVFYLTEAFWL